MKTELLWQPLRFAHQSPNPPGYRSQAFAAFGLGTPTVSLPTKPGWYAPAYRFVLGRNHKKNLETLLAFLGRL